MKHLRTMGDAALILAVWGILGGVSSAALVIAALVMIAVAVARLLGIGA